MNTHQSSNFLSDPVPLKCSFKFIGERIFLPFLSTTQDSNPQKSPRQFPKSPRSRTSNSRKSIDINTPPLDDPDSDSALIFSNLAKDSKYLVSVDIESLTSTPIIIKTIRAFTENQASEFTQTNTKMSEDANFVFFDTSNFSDYSTTDKLFVLAPREIYTHIFSLLPKASGQHLVLGNIEIEFASIPSASYFESFKIFTGLKSQDPSNLDHSSNHSVIPLSSLDFSQLKVESFTTPLPPVTVAQVPFTISIVAPGNAIVGEPVTYSISVRNNTLQFYQLEFQSQHSEEFVSSGHKVQSFSCYPGSSVTSTYSLVALDAGYIKYPNILIWIEKPGSSKSHRRMILFGQIPNTDPRFVFVTPS